MIEVLGPNAKKGRGSVSRIPSVSDPSTQPFKGNRKLISHKGGSSAPDSAGLSFSLFLAIVCLLGDQAACRHVFFRECYRKDFQ